jgi:hypothetical protein
MTKSLLVSDQFQQVFGKSFALSIVKQIASRQKIPNYLDFQCFVKFRVVP